MVLYYIRRGLYCWLGMTEIKTTTATTQLSSPKCQCCQANSRNQAIGGVERMTRCCDGIWWQRSSKGLHCQHWNQWQWQWHGCHCPSANAAEKKQQSTCKRGWKDDDVLGWYQQGGQCYDKDNDDIVASVYLSFYQTSSLQQLPRGNSNWRHLCALQKMVNGYMKYT